MKIVGQLWRRLLLLLRRSKREREMEEEMRFHLEMQIEQNLDAGMEAEKAYYAARRQFGNQTWLKEASREMWSLNSLETLMHDMRYGARVLQKNPGFTAVAVLTLALGIGANTAIFSVVNAVLLQPLPYPEAKRLVLISENFTQRGLNRIFVSAPEYLDYRERSGSFAQVAAFRRQPFTLTGSGEAELLQGTVCSTNLFETLGIRPALGRAFLPGEDRPGSNQVVVLSHSLWQRRFGADPRLVGQRLTLNDNVVEVVGIMPPAAQFPPLTDVWSPIAFTNELLSQRQGPRNLSILAQLKPESDLPAAQAEMDLLGRRLQEQYPEVYPTALGWSVSVTSLRERVVGDVQTALWTLLGAVGFVLLIACANVASLLLARAATRQRELAIRSALGARRARIVRQLLTESLMLSLAGGALGLLIAWYAIEALPALVPDALPATAAVRIDAVTLTFTAIVSLLTGAGFGLAPAIRATKPDLAGALKESGRGVGVGRYGLGGGLVVMEIALSTVLLIGAGLLIRSFMRVLAVDPGFTPQKVLTMSLALPQTEYPEQLQVANFYQEVLQRVERSPGVEAAAMIAGLPFTGSSSTWGFTTGAKPQPRNEETLEATNRVVSPGYFAALKIPLIRGRDFTTADNENAPGTVIINETMARRYWPNDDALGKRIKLGSPEPQRTWDGLWLTIIGVAGDVRADGFEEEVRPEMYLSYLQNPWRGLPTRPYMTLVGRAMTIVARGSAEPGGLTAALRQAVAAVDKNQPVTAVATMESLLAASLAGRRFSLSLLGLFAAIALTLAAIGLYGVMSYSVSQRTGEIGLRMALGAQKSDVLRMVIARGMRLTLIGALIGLAGALALTRVIANLLFGVGATDPLTFTAVSVLLALVALLACYVPARRATKVDPLVALRFE